MTFRNRILLCISAAVCVASCDTVLDPPEDNSIIESLPRELSIAEGMLIEADNAFAFKLFREVNESAGDSNVFISPLSVAMALGMTYNGAAGSTLEAMQHTLGLEGMTIDEVNQSYRDLIDLLSNLDHRVEFTLANSIWFRDTWTFNPDFLQINQEYFDAEVSGLDFNSSNAGPTINNWVDEKTNGKISDIVPNIIPPDYVMYLINAIYFKADWAAQFDESLTESGSFWLEDGTEISTEMMYHDKRATVYQYSDSDVRIVDMPYGGQAYSMTIVLPDEPSAIDSLSTALSQDRWNTWIAGLNENGVMISMPKFTIEYDIELKGALEALGMGVAFEPFVADLSGMCCQPGNLFIGELKHKAFVEVNEEGTEAAAATSVGVVATSAGPHYYYIDRPFAFVIREKYSGAILFMGKVMDPRG